jgi:CIC family chloride channel protein
MTPFQRLRSSFFSQEQIILLTLGVVVGVLAGYCSVGFRILIDFLREIIYGSSGNFIEVLSHTPWYMQLLIPVVGGLIVGPMIYFWAREAKGHGVPEVMEAVTLKGGYIRKRVGVVKTAASAVTIAVGGSVGLEGPFIQIGSALGSAVGQIFHTSASRMRILVGCGAAAGIAATFNAPVAGMMFALEIVLGEFAIPTFSPIVISAVMATAVSRSYLGDFPTVMVPQYELVTYYELGFYAVLGALAGLVGVTFTTVLYKIEDLVDSIKFPEYLKTAMAGFALAVIGLGFPSVLGVGYEGIQLALHNQLAWWMLLAAVVMKILATSISLAGGMSGGIFAPSLFMGAMLGGCFGHFLNMLFPTITAGGGAYAVVGMGAVVAATTHGPMSAFLILFEMTGGYKIILPLMIGCVVATLVAQWVRPESIYTLKLLRRGVDVQAGKEMNLLKSMTVSQAMREDEVEKLPQNMTLRNFAALLAHSKHASFPVVDEQGGLCGILSHADYADYVNDQMLWDVVVVSEMATRKVVTVTPDDTLDVALRRISTRDFATLPVVASEKDSALVGVISHRDIISTYSGKVAKASLGQQPAGSEHS